MKRLMLLCALATLAFGRAHAAAPATPEAYCTATGGVVQTRIPAYGTNNNNPLLLNDPQ